MADLMEAANTFAQDLKNQNLAGLMMAFTPPVGQAMGLQAQLQASGQPADPNATVTAVAAGEEGALKLVDLVFKGATGEQTIATKWADVGGSWKVDGISLKA
ncbi:MAG: hypothetical protein LC118_13815 [Dehalococcoidia bacterium]|nr:hypothetical protein [Dehalococcoidia bacterium]